MPTWQKFRGTEFPQAQIDKLNHNDLQAKTFENVA